MARNVKITFRVDSSGAVRGVDRVEDELDELDTSSKKASRSLDKAGKETRQLGQSAQTSASKTQKLSKSLKIGLAAAATAAAAAVARSAAKMAGELFQLGIDIQETRNNYEKQFGAMAGVMDDFLEDWKDLVSVTTQEGEAMLATIGSIFDGLGLTSEQTAELSQRAATLAADLASIQNVETQRALDAITASLLGQNRQLKSLGVSVSKSVVKQKALEEGIIETDRALTAQERAMAAVEAVADRMGSSVGDAADTQDSMRRQAENLQRDLRELKAEMARELLPTFIEFTDELTDFVEKNEDEIIDSVRNLGAAFAFTAKKLARLVFLAKQFGDLTTFDLGGVPIGPGALQALILGGFEEGEGPGVPFGGEPTFGDTQGVTFGGGGGADGGGDGGGGAQGAAQQLRRELEKQMRILEQMVQLPLGPTAQDQLREELKIVKDLIKKGIQDMGMDASDEIIKQFRERLRALRAQLRKEIREIGGPGGATQVEGAGPEGTGPFDIQPSDLAQPPGQFDPVQNVEDFGDIGEREMTRILNTAADIGRVLENAFERGEMSARDFVASILPILGQITGAIFGSPQLGGAAGRLAAIPFSASQTTAITSGGATSRSRGAIQVNIQNQLARLPNDDVGVITREADQRNELWQSSL